MDFRFRNGKFTVLQVSDAQDIQYVRKTMLYMLDKAYDRVNPDLIVLTGDNIMGNHLDDLHPLNSLIVKTDDDVFRGMKTALHKLLDPIEKRKIPFAMIYGNHDDLNNITKDEQADIYRTFSCCTGLDDDNGSPDCDTYNIPILSEDGTSVRYNLWMLDSSWLDHEKDEVFGYVKPEAVEWYKNKSAELKAQNGGEPVPSIMFQHIPLIETLRLIEECPKKESSAKGPDGKYYRLRSGCDGVMGEYPSVVTKDVGQFEAMKECGDVKAVAFGHDHLNCFCGNVDGIDFIQTSCASFRCYGDRNRGVRVFTLYEDGRYGTQFLSYYDLCGKNPVTEFRYFRDADDMIPAKIAVLAGTALTAAGAAIYRKYKNKKRYV